MMSVRTGKQRHASTGFPRAFTAGRKRVLNVNIQEGSIGDDSLLRDHVEKSEFAPSNVAFPRWKMSTLRCRERTGKEYRRSGLVISREQGLRYDAGFAVPVLMS